jgi:hypothetical protein
MTKRIRTSEAVQRAKCAKPRVNHAWTAGFVATNGPWAKMTGKLIWINDSIGELWVLFQPKGVLLGKCRCSPFGQNQFMQRKTRNAPAAGDTGQCP